MSIDWNSSKTEVLLNPRLDCKIAANAIAVIPKSDHFSSHLWLTTSGSSAANAEEIKFAALSKEAILVSAKAVSCHLNLGSKDVWVNSLPPFHVGGLAVSARSFICGMKVVELTGKWQAQRFVEVVNAQQATFSSLVPAQVYDLVCAKIQKPKSLNAILVGGGQLSEYLYHKASSLGWKLLPSYGMTEAGSTIASAGIDSSSDEFPNMHLLSHMDVKTSDDGYLLLKGKSLLTSYAYISQGSCRLTDPKKEGWLLTEDKGEVSNGQLIVLGRGSDFVKIGGENVELPPLRALIDEIALSLNYQGDFALVAVPDTRLGSILALVAAKNKSPEINAIVEKFDRKVLPYERIRQVHYLKELPRSELGKILTHQIIPLISQGENFI